MSKPLLIRGGMADSSLVRNGWSFDAEGFAALASNSPEMPFVLDHNMDVAAIAGHVTKVTATRYTAKVMLAAKDGEKAEAVEMAAVRLGREAILTPESPAYEMACRVISSYHAAGKTPQTSFSIIPSAVSYDAQRDALRLEPPYRLVHDSLVSSGAFSPEDGTGIEAIEEMADFAASPDARPVIFSQCVITASVPEAMAVAFSIANAANPAALLAASRAGLIAKFEPKIDEPGTKGAGTLELSSASPPSPPQGEPSSPPGAKHMPNEPPTPPAGAGTTPAPPTSAELEALVSAQVDKRFTAERATRDAVALAAKRQTIVDTYGAAEAVVNKMDASGLEAFETHLRNEESLGLVRRAPKKNTPDDGKDAHFKALDEGREAFIKSIALRGAL